MDFGEYLEENRKSRNYTLRLFAKRINISYTYLADVEKSRSKAFKLEILKSIVEVLQLDEKETDMFYDLAGLIESHPHDITITKEAPNYSK